MELLDALKTRRSHRSYHKDKPVPRETILELIAAARLAPSSCNLQLTQYVVIDDQALLDELAKSVSYKFEYAPACIVVIYDPRITVEHHSAVMTAGMEVENLLLRATELGLGACPLAGFSHDRKIKRRLGIPDHLELLLLISVGCLVSSSVAMSEGNPLNMCVLMTTFSFAKYERINSTSSIIFTGSC
jgi:nitroreductase